MCNKYYLQYVFDISVQKYVLMKYVYLTLAFSEKISILQKMPSAWWLVGQNAPHVKKDEVATKCHMGPILRKQFAQCNLFCLACETEDIINATSDQR